ncbi:type I DNA topoisomerase [Chitinispirillales bacterium ANBcel5]|uniref:type I DNA topoisomerase n=1 Tax=Cellulosispirillum alkaliphilum TaxID=3039283 RepID=UPI002A552D61|nr:type I DNA topoisomerase [Chitinispirillales bacterium ANBcel5]
MAKHLVVVESPAKCKTISKYLGKDFAVRATMGHIIDLPEKELGVDIERDFKPKYTPSKGKRRVLRELKDEAAKADDIYLAPDPDREGEAIAWHVAQSIAKENGNIKRVMFNEITKRAVLSAFDDPHQIDMNKVNAQQARRILDRIVGYQVSPILWRTVFRGLSAGRVQSVALRLICEREDEINAFEKKEYWSIHGTFEYDKTQFSAKLVSIEGRKASNVDKPLLPDETAAKSTIDRLKRAEFKVIDVQKTEKKRKPYPPFITSTLQQEASRKLNFSAAKTMMIAQQLYEGLELGHLGSMGLITYMRTDSTRIATEALNDARSLIATMFTEKHLPSAPRLYGKNKNAQDAHEAIRPSQVQPDLAPEKVKQFLTKDQFRLYELIWKRFLASQMENALFDSTRVDIDGDKCVLRANGSIMKFDGFLALYDESVDESSESSDKQDEKIPVLKVDDKPALKALSDKQHFTQPPPRYTEASLVRELEDKGIGRPSTYAQIIDTLKRRKYTEVESRRFKPTEIGYMVKNILIREFPKIFDVHFTADMESTLDNIEEGNAEWVNVLKEFYSPFADRLNDVRKNIKDLRAQNQEVTDRTCPECQEHPLVVKWSRNGKFLACQGFPSCKYTEPLEKIEVETTDEKCDKCGSPMVVLSIKGNKFLGCSKYPDCKNTRSISTGVTCPQEGCDGAIVQRKTRRGKVFFGCSNYPNCTFASWDPPVDKKCEKCGYPILVRKENKRKGVFLRCLSCKVEYPEEGETTTETTSTEQLQQEK